MDATTLATVTAGIGTAVTAVATIALWRVTAVLAKETTRMANATGQPQIVATLRPNRWTMMYADLTVSNAGNGAAFSVTMEFDPPLQTEDDNARSDQKFFPFQEISILRPGESMSSNIGKSYPLLEKSYRVTTTWLRHPQALTRETLSYTLSMADSKGVTQLGASDPLVQIASEVKHIREDWRSVAGGSRRTKTEVYTSSDRLHEDRQRERSRRAYDRKVEGQRGSTNASGAEGEPHPPSVKIWSV